MSWVVYAVEAVGVGVLATLGLLIVAVLAGAIAVGIFGLDRMRRVLWVIGILAFVGGFASFGLVGSAGPDSLPLPFLLLLISFIVWAVLSGDLWHVSQRLVLGVGTLMVAGSWLVLFPLQVHADAAHVLGLGGIFLMLWAPKVVGQFLRSREPGAESFWHPSRWSPDIFYVLLLFPVLIAIPWATQLAGHNYWLMLAIVSLPAAPLVIAPILRHRLWHPSVLKDHLSVYRVGLLAVAVGLIVAALGARMAAVPLLCAGAVLTLYGNLRHLSQWLAAAAGVAVVGGALAFSGGVRNPDVVLLAGLMTIVLLPGLIGALKKFGFWREGRWTSDELLGLLFFLGLLAIPVLRELGLVERYPWLILALVGWPVALLMIALLLKRRLSVYGAGLMVVAGSVAVIGIAGNDAERLQVVGVLLFIAGVVTTLVGSLRHLRHWLAAGAGFAVISGAVALHEQRDLSGMTFLVGVLIVLFAPKLMDRYLLRRQRASENAKARDEMEKAREELRELRLRPPLQAGLMVKPASSKLHLVKAYIEETGASLVEAKSAVEKLLGEA